MNPTRIEILKKYHEEDPHDPFPIYALALEYQATDPEKAQQFFEQLLTIHPQYLPTYYMAGIFFADQDEINRALEILLKGLTLAKAQNNPSASRELQAALDNLID